MASLDSASFVPLACVRVASARLLAGACSPDKDLFVLLTRAQNKDRLALWKIKGAKKWEVEVCIELAEPESVAGVAWSPDGLSILVAHQPPRLSLHSLQDGRELQSIPVNVHPDAALTGVWWLKNTPKPVPDVWKRDELVPGSALSTLAGLPLLDPFKDYHQPTQTNAFAFGTATTGNQTAAMPPVFHSWPALAPNLRLSSIAPTEFGTQDTLDDDDALDRDSLVVATDSTGALHCFLDGVYALGAVALGVPCTVTALAAPPPDAARVLVHARSAGRSTNARPLPVHLDLLRARSTRDVAQVSTAARDLTWYALRVVREMRETWVGNGSNEAVAGLGKRWVKSLETRIQTHTTAPPHPIFELTLLLTTGRISDGLHDMLTGAEKAAGPERPPNINRWETLMTDALVKLRDYSERRVSPACQRLLVLLQDVRGWSKMPQESETLLLEEQEIDEIVLLVRRACELSAWLAAAARDELERFRHFISWLKTETMNANSDAPSMYSLRHDVLEVNEYIMRGLTGSVLDGWFFDGEFGSVPRVSPSDRRAPRPKSNLAAVLAEAKAALAAKAAGPETYALAHEKRQLDGVERNVEALLLDVARRCSEVFAKAAAAATRAAALPKGRFPVSMSTAQGAAPAETLVCERVELDAESATHYAAVYLAPHKKLCVLRVSGDSAEATVFDCVAASGPVELLAMDFFDGETLAVVLRSVGTDRLYLTLVDYASASYTPITDNLTGAASREQLAADFAAQVQGTALPVRQSRPLRMRLAQNDTSRISIAVNGRAGRRVGCVHLESTGELETFDLESEEEDEEMVDASF